MLEPERKIMINMPLIWRLVILIAAVGLVPALMLAQWVAHHWSRSYAGARLRGWWWRW